LRARNTARGGDLAQRHGVPAQQRQERRRLGILIADARRAIWSTTCASVQEPFPRSSPTPDIAASLIRLLPTVCAGVTAAVFDYTKIQALATLGLAETLRDVAGQVPEVAQQIALASRR
jgi:hypothetical protein